MVLSERMLEVNLSVVFLDDTRTNDQRICNLQAIIRVVGGTRVHDTAFPTTRRRVVAFRDRPRMREEIFIGELSEREA